jgi:hypothetical protein
MKPDVTYRTGYDMHNPMWHVESYMTYCTCIQGCDVYEAGCDKPDMIYIIFFIYWFLQHVYVTYLKPDVTYTEPDMTCTIGCDMSNSLWPWKGFISLYICPCIRAYYTRIYIFIYYLATYLSMKPFDCLIHNSTLSKYLRISIVNLEYALESNTSYFNMLVHEVRGGCSWYGSR